jgi:hypothetical protein
MTAHLENGPSGAFERPTLEMLSCRALSVKVLLALVTDSQHDH